MRGRRASSGSAGSTRTSEIRIVKRLLLLLALAALCPAPVGCRALLKEVFETPRVRLVSVGFASNPFTAPKGPIEAVLHLQVINPNSYGLTVSGVRYAAAIGAVTLAEGERNEETRIGPSGETLVKVPVTLRSEAFSAALRQVMEARAIPYEFCGSVEVVAPLAGTVRVPFSKTGTIDPIDILRKKGFGFN
ncbi:MAG TPA: LEA type 2 family protein [Candidatus Deferrimicrobiaceae bacterium]